MLRHKLLLFVQSVGHVLTYKAKKLGAAAVLGAGPVSVTCCGRSVFWLSGLGIV